MSDACREWRGEIAALALGRLTPEQRARVVAHADACEDCRSELAELEQVTRAVALADASRLDHEPAPPPELRERILTQLRAERADVRRAAHRRTRRFLAAAAAALIIVAGVGLAVRQSDDDDHIPFDIALDDSRGEFALHRTATGTSITMRYEGLDDGEVYWLWLTDATGRRVGAGTFIGTSDEHSMTMQAALPIDRVVRVWVTDEDDATVLDKEL
jgi:hypothetical protein